jgi:ABC-type transport system involved in cytochrome c biogenesis permease subunit
MERVTVVCFVASYAVALALELWRLYRPRAVLTVAALGAAAAGLLAQTIYLAVQRPPLAWQFGYLLLIAWALVVFYIGGTMHRDRSPLGVFVLPLVLGLVGLGALGTFFDPPPDDQRYRFEGLFTFQTAHSGLLLLAAIGLCVGCVASLMYLFQAHRLRVKTPPARGLRLLSLERLETMNRRAVAWAFPMLTLGLVIGVALLFHGRIEGWVGDRRVWSAVVLWLAFAVLVYLRYAVHLRGRPVAVLTIMTFVLLLTCLTLSHPVGQGGAR